MSRDKRWAANKAEEDLKLEKITLVLCMHEFIGTCSRPDVNVLRKAISKKWPPDNGSDSGISKKKL